ncbi:MAG: FtsQ-type POTRA domain-containing protein [Rubricoccaceae bacterium]|nr:FtsQ-type POTRA domain-containing protein [Rubricoccaceae bacterium]
MLGGVGLSVLALLATAWSWQRSLPLKRVVVSGTVHSDSADVVRFAAVERDSTTTLFSIDPDLVADRVRRAPWVRNASIRRRPSGTLSIRVEEREPVVLVIGSDGRPVSYLDAEGYSMPLVEGALYDVPLLRGQTARQQPNQPIENESTLELLVALSEIDMQTDALISEVHVDSRGRVELRMSPGAGHESIPVELGAADFKTKFERLYTFWRQAVLTRPERDFQSIDLRFDGQVVTRESMEENIPNPQMP